MIILGIDPGTATTGYGIIKTESSKYRTKNKGQNLQCLSFGCIETSPGEDFPKRLLFLSKEIRKLMKNYQPKLVAIETLFFFQNQKTVIRVSQAIGVVLLTLERTKTSIVEYSPQEVKKSLTQNGRADKCDVQNQVRKLLKLKKAIKKDDAADALAIAICAARKHKNLKT